MDNLNENYLKLYMVINLGYELEDFELINNSIENLTVEYDLEN